MGQHHQSLKKIAYFLFAFAAFALQSTANPVTVSYLDQIPYSYNDINVYGILNFDPLDLGEGALPGSYIQISGSIQDIFFIPNGAPVTLSPNDFPSVSLFNLNSANPIGYGSAGQTLYDYLTTAPGQFEGEEQVYLWGLYIGAVIPAGDGYWVGYNPPTAVPDSATAGGLLFGSLAVLAAAKRRIRKGVVTL